MDETPLSEYMGRHCLLSTTRMSEPWTIEDDVVRLLNPPINLRPGYHEFRREVEAARDRLWEACGLPPRARAK